MHDNGYMGPTFLNNDWFVIEFVKSTNLEYTANDGS